MKPASFFIEGYSYVGTVLPNSEVQESINVSKFSFFTSRQFDWTQTMQIASIMYKLYISSALTTVYMQYWYLPTYVLYFTLVHEKIHDHKNYIKSPTNVTIHNCIYIWKTTLPSHICMYSVMLVYLQIMFCKSVLQTLGFAVDPPLAFSIDDLWTLHAQHFTFFPTANFKFSPVRTRCLPYSCVKGTVACDFLTLAFFMNKYLSNQDSPNGIVSILVPISHRYLKI